MTTSILDQITVREKQLWQLLSPPVLVENQQGIELPLTPEKVKEILNNFDENTMVSDYKSQLSDIITDINTQDTSFNTMIFSWFYDGGEEPDHATGIAYEKCEVNYDFLVSNGHLERENPFLEGQTYELDYLFTGNVLDSWYELDMNVFFGLGDDICIQTSEIDFIELSEVYNELFTLKLMSFLAKAYAQITTKKPKYFFIQRQDRWPLLISDN